MKIMRLNALMAVLALAGLTIFSSCNNDDNGDDNGQPQPNKPSLQFIGSGDYIAQDATINAGDTAKFSWVVQKGDNDLKRFTITGGEQGGTLFDSANLSKNNASNYSDQFSTVMTQAGDHTFTFEVWDSEDLKTSKSITVTVRENDPLKSYNAVLMGAQDNANNGSYYATSQDSVYFASGFNKSNAQYIDFIYYYGATNNATIAAPADATVEEFNAYDVETWNQRNATKFMSVNASFSNFQKESDLFQYRSTLQSSSTTKANQLSTSSVYVFLTEQGKIGAFQVNNINNQGSGTIEISVKVEP